ncbi:MAG: hypothetical protein U1D35_14520 [Paracoccaceae bacterium]|nr:hypothetical protein [Paracoccaceae bacterium]
MMENTVMKRMFRHLRPFARNDEGTVLVEAVLVIPALFWAMLALFVYWDTYRSINTVQKASYTISDTISREKVDIDSTDLTGLRNLMNYLLDSDQATKLRVTSLQYNSVEEKYEVLWSCSPNSALPKQTDATLALVSNRLPVMPVGDTVVLVETEVGYSPPFEVGISPLAIKQFIVTRPRRAPSIILTSCAA